MTLCLLYSVIVTLRGNAVSTSGWGRKVGALIKAKRNREQWKQTEWINQSVNEACDLNILWNFHWSDTNIWNKQHYSFIQMSSWFLHFFTIWVFSSACLITQPFCVVFFCNGATNFFQHLVKFCAFCVSDSNFVHIQCRLTENDLSLNVLRWFRVMSVCWDWGESPSVTEQGRPCLCKPQLLQLTICDN